MYVVLSNYTMKNKAAQGKSVYGVVMFTPAVIEMTEVKGANVFERPRRSLYRYYILHLLNAGDARQTMRSENGSERKVCVSYRYISMFVNDMKYSLQPCSIVREPLCQPVLLPCSCVVLVFSLHSKHMSRTHRLTLPES